MQTGQTCRHAPGQMADLAEHLRSITNRWGRPYEEITINTHVYPAKALDAWMTAQGIDGDFAAVDTATLNRYFRDYYRRHGQGGTNAQQRNLLPLFSPSRRNTAIRTRTRQSSTATPRRVNQSSA